MPNLNSDKSLRECGLSQLLLLTAVVGLVLAMLQSLTHASHIAVSEDAPDAGKERPLFPIALDVLVLQKGDKRLRGS